MAITPEKKKQTTTTTTTPKPKAVAKTNASSSEKASSRQPSVGQTERADSTEERPSPSSTETPSTSQEMRVPGNLSDPVEDRPVSPLDPPHSADLLPASSASLSEKPDRASASPSTAPDFVPRSVVASSDPEALADFLAVERESGDPAVADAAMQELMAAARANPGLVAQAVTRAEELERKAENQAIMERRRVAEHNMLTQGIDAHYASELDRRRATEGF